MCLLMFKSKTVSGCKRRRKKVCVSRYLSIFRGSGHLPSCYGNHVRMDTQADKRKSNKILSHLYISF